MCGFTVLAGRFKTDIMRVISSLTARSALFWAITQRVLVLEYHYSVRNSPEEHSSSAVSFTRSVCFPYGSYGSYCRVTIFFCCTRVVHYITKGTVASKLNEVFCDVTHLSVQSQVLISNRDTSCANFLPPQIAPVAVICR